MAGGGAPRPVFHPERPEGRGGRGLAGVSPCLKCGTCASLCWCDVEREERVPAPGGGGRARAGQRAGPSGPGGAPRTLARYSFEDGRRDYPSPRVSVFVPVPAPAGERLGEGAVDVAFEERRVSVRVTLPSGAFALAVPDLFAAIVPAQSRWAVRGSTVVLRLAKADPKLKWHGLSRVTSAVARGNDGARDLALRMLGVEPPPPPLADEADVIKTAERPRHSGPPKYEWDKYDREMDYGMAADAMDLIKQVGARQG